MNYSSAHDFDYSTLIKINQDFAVPKKAQTLDPVHRPTRLTLNVQRTLRYCGCSPLINGLNYPIYHPAPTSTICHKLIQSRGIPPPDSPNRYGRVRIPQTHPMPPYIVSSSTTEQYALPPIKSLNMGVWVRVLRCSTACIACELPEPPTRWAGQGRVVSVGGYCVMLSFLFVGSPPLLQVID